MRTASQDSTDSDGEPRTASAAVVALVYAPTMCVAMLLWLRQTYDGLPGPVAENASYLLPAAGVIVLVSGVLLRARGIRAPFLTSAFAAFATVFPIAFLIAHNNYVPDWILPLFLTLPVPVAFVALKIGDRCSRARLRLPVAWAATAVILLLIDGAVRYPESQEQQLEAASALDSYDTVAVLDAPGWTLTHAYDESDFPELVYRDLLGRTVLLGSTQHPLPAQDEIEEDQTDGGFSTEVLEPGKCGTSEEEPSQEEPREEHCEEQEGLLVVDMLPPTADRLKTDGNGRWPAQWTEVRMEASDGRYIRLRTDSAGVDLVDLARATEVTAYNTPKETVAEASCLLRCPVWRNYFP